MVDLSYLNKLNCSSNPARDATRQDVQGKQSCQHYIKQPFGTEIISVYSLEDIRVAICRNQAELVGTCASEVLLNNFTTTTIMATVRVSKTGNRGAQRILDDRLRATNLSFYPVKGYLSFLKDPLRNTL